MVRLETPRLILRTAVLADAPSIIAYLEGNRDHFSLTSPRRPDEYYTLKYWESAISKFIKDHDQGVAVRLILSERTTGALLGDVNLTNIVRGYFCAGYLGFKLDHQRQGQGLMHEALSSFLEYAFDELLLNRIMANYMPENERSAHLLARLGFKREGYAQRYLYINGKWRDHVLTSALNPNPPSP